MKTVVSALSLLFLFSLLGCGPTSVNNQSAASSPKPLLSPAASPPSASPAVTKNGDYPGKGRITKINKDLGSVELAHEEIKNLMPAMIMEFYVNDKKLLDGLAVKDNADFVVRYKDGQEIIVDINKTK